jgi:uncharacterized protein
MPSHSKAAHFTGYETGALKRLMGRYATREDEIDRMLRAHLRQQRAAALAARLHSGVAEDAPERNEEQSARWLLANLLDWHRREAKSEWHEFYRLAELSDEDLLDEKSAVSGLRFVERLGILRKIPTDRYAFEKQETDIRAGDELCLKGQDFGDVVAIDKAARTIDIKKTKKMGEIHLGAVYVMEMSPDTNVLADSLYQIAAWVADNRMDAPGPYSAARDLLLRRSPRLTNGATTLVLPVRPPWTSPSAWEECLIIRCWPFKGHRALAKLILAHA